VLFNQIAVNAFSKKKGTLYQAENIDAVCVGLARTVIIRTVYDRVFGDFPAKNTVYIHRILPRIR